MPDDPYSLTDLARLAGVTPRTIRYYVTQGLLPSPEAAGPATRYGEGHLARLRLIRRMQRDHLPLAEIRNRLERMGEDEMRAVVDVQPAAPAPAETLAYVRDLMAQSGVQPRVAESRAAYPLAQATFEPMIPDGFPQPVAQPAASPSMPAPAYPALPPASVPAPPARPAERSTWERHVLAPDVELHVRRPLDRHLNKRVEQLLRVAKELLDDEP